MAQAGNSENDSNLEASNRYTGVESMLAASPTWYCSSAIDSDQKNRFYFVGNTSLFVCQLDTHSGGRVRNLLHINVCKTRAIGVSVCNDPNGPWKCVTAGDGRVRLWNLDTCTCTDEHSTHKTAVVSCVQWSPVDHGLIVTADSAGQIVTWKPVQNTCHVMTPHQDGGGSHVTVLACSPHSAALCAVGYKDSTVLLIDLTAGGRVLQRLRGHDEEIQGISWCPQPGEQFLCPDELANEQGALLVTGSKDRSMRIWSSTSGRCLLSTYLPSSSTGKAGRGGEERHGNKLWLTVCWLPGNNSRRIISTSYNGEILQWDITQTENGCRLKSRTYSQSRHASAHRRMAFNLCACANGSYACSSSMDRQIVVWNVEEGKARFNITTLGGFAYCIEQSPIQPGHVAIGCGDQLIRVWNVQNSANPLDTHTYWQGLKSKVTTLTWHPQKEGKLAYGTEDGRVGIYDLFSKLPKLSGTFHKGTVYTVVWGPSIAHAQKHSTDAEGTNVDSPESGAPLSVYSVGDGRILEHFPDRLEQPAFNVMEHLTRLNSAHIQAARIIHSEIRWKEDTSAVVVGNDDGSVFVFAYPALTLLCKVHVHRKLINALRWHPLYTADLGQQRWSPHQHWLASASSESVVYVVDLTPVFKTQEEAQDSPRQDTLLVTQPTVELTGHTFRVTSLAWSQHTAARLATASYDYTVRVWDVKTGQAIAEYRGHTARLLSVTFSDLDSDLVYSGGQDNTVQCWRPSRHPVRDRPKLATPPGLTMDKKKTKKKKKKSSAHEPDVTSQQEIKVDATSRDPEVTSQQSADMAELRELLEAKRRELSDRTEPVKCQVEQNEDIETPINTQDNSDSNKKADNEPNRAGGADFGGKAEQERQIDEVIVKNVDTKERKRKKLKSLLPTSSQRENRGKALQQEDCLALLTFMQDRPVELGEEWYHLGHLLDRKATYELFRREIEYHISQENWDQQLILEAFRGNLSALSTESRDHHNLSDWLLALTSASVNGGKTMASVRGVYEAFAAQLKREQAYHKAATYMLAIHQVYEAIEMLRSVGLYKDALCLCRVRLVPGIKQIAYLVYEAIDMLRSVGLYKDALCLCRVRLVPTDPVIKQLLSSWAQTLAADSNCELAAKCSLSAGDVLEAARCLSRRSDTGSVLTAALLCARSGHLTESRVYGDRLVQDCMLAVDWLTAQRGWECGQHVQNYTRLIATHECIVNALVQSGDLASTVLLNAQSSEPLENETQPPLTVFLLDPTPSDILVPWLVRAHDDEGQCFIHALVQCWVRTWGLDMKIDSLQSAYEHLATRKPVLQGLLQTPQLLISVSYDIAMGTLQALLGNANMAAQHWSLALATAVERGQASLTTSDLGSRLCGLLLPRGPSQLRELCQQLFAVTVSCNQRQLATHPPSNLAFSLSNRCGCHDNGGSSKEVKVNKNRDEHKEGDKSQNKEADNSCLNINAISMQNNVSNDDKSDSNVCVNSDSVEMSPWDFLQGYYAYCVLHYWNGKASSLSQPHCDKEGNSANNVCTRDEPDLTGLSQAALVEVARSLLWDVQVKKHMVQDSLKLIAKALMKVQSVSDDASNCITPRRPDTADHLRVIRAMSGDYMSMDGGTKRPRQQPRTTQSVPKYDFLLDTPEKAVMGNGIQDGGQDGGQDSGQDGRQDGGQDGGHRKTSKESKPEVEIEEEEFVPPDPVQSETNGSEVMKARKVLNLEADLTVNLPVKDEDRSLAKSPISGSQLSLSDVSIDVSGNNAPNQSVEVESRAVFNGENSPKQTDGASLSSQCDSQSNVDRETKVHDKALIIFTDDEDSFVLSPTTNASRIFPSPHMSEPFPTPPQQKKHQQSPTDGASKKGGKKIKSAKKAVKDKPSPLSLLPPLRGGGSVGLFRRPNPLVSAFKPEDQNSEVKQQEFKEKSNTAKLVCDTSDTMLQNELNEAIKEHVSPKRTGNMADQIPQVEKTETTPLLNVETLCLNDVSTDARETTQQDDRQIDELCTNLHPVETNNAAPEMEKQNSPNDTSVASQEREHEQQYSSTTSGIKEAGNKAAVPENCAAMENMDGKNSANDTSVASRERESKEVVFTEDGSCDSVMKIESHEQQYSSTTSGIKEAGNKAAVPENCAAMENMDGNVNTADSLAIDIRYSGDHLSANWLLGEKSRLEAELQYLPSLIKDFPFPHPMDSVPVLLNLASLRKYDRIHEKLRQWLHQHAYVTKHYEILADNKI